MGKGPINSGWCFLGIEQVVLGFITFVDILIKSPTLYTCAFDNAPLAAIITERAFSRAVWAALNAPARFERYRSMSGCMEGF